MKKIMMTMLGMAALPILANTPPEITNVRASQREDTKLVDIYYDAADADGDLLKVRIEISDNDGAKYSVPAFSLTGDIGEGIAAGKDKHIVWDAGTDWDGEYSDKMRVKVYAIDAQGFPGLEWGNEVPPGGFLMGQDGGAEGSGPSRHVNIPWSYWLSKYEITAEQYCEFLNAAYTAGNVYLDGTTYVRSYGNGIFEGYCNAGVALCRIGDSQNIRWNVNKFETTNGNTNYPVKVSYYGAMAFCRFYDYDLPTEAEWEKAARGPDNDDQDEHLLYPWGDTISSAYANYFYNGDYREPSGFKPVGYYDGNQTPVGPDTINGYGLYDVIGNAAEWTRTSYSESIASYPQEDSVIDVVNLPFRHLYSVSDQRVYRGVGPIYLRKGCDQSGDCKDYDHLGFRVARRNNNVSVKTCISTKITFDWNQLVRYSAVDSYTSGPTDYSGSFAMVENGTGNAVKCISGDNDYDWLYFNLSRRQVAYFTIKIKNTDTVVRNVLLNVLSYKADSSSSLQQTGSASIILPANMTEFKTVSFGGAPSLYRVELHLTSGVVIDDLEFHTIAE